jgi:inosose dehydratase
MADLGKLRYACQTYSWQMSIDTYAGRVEHMVQAAAAAGFSGFEPELVMLGRQWSVAELRDILAARSIELAALVLAKPWLGDEESTDERADADRVIAATAALPGSKIVLCPVPGPNRSTLDRRDVQARQTRVMGHLRAVAERAAEAGVPCTFHPNSPAGSLFRTQEDYQRMAELLPELIGYTPDLGHIAKGGMDPLTVVREWGDRVDHVHVKDLAADGSWAETGSGTVDIAGVLTYLAERRYGGWVTFEDESPQAEQDPDTATAKNGRYVEQVCQPVATGGR